MKSNKLRIALILLAGVTVTGLGYWTGYQQGQTSAKAQALAANTPKKTGTANRSSSLSLGGNSQAGQTLEQLLNSTGRPDFNAINDWAKSLSLEQTAAAMTELQAMPAGAARDNILRSLVNEWGAKDPKGLLAATDTITVPRLREGGITNALRTLAADNPKDALDWIKQSAADTSSADLARRYAAAIGGVASNDPAGALALAGNLSEATPADRTAKTRAMESVANAMAQQGKYSDAVALFAQMPAGQSQTDAMAQLANRWSQSAPLDAAAWVGSIQDPRLRSSVGSDLVSNWAASDPAAAAQWAAQMDTQAAAAAAAGGPGGGRGGANQSQTLLADAVSTWARYDLNAAGQFINDLPASAMKNNAIASFATQAARDDPTSAVNWVNTITNPRAKATATQQVVMEVAQQDPRSAMQILNSSTVLTDQQKQDMLTTIQTNRRTAPAQNNGGGGGGGGRGFGGGGGGGGGGGFGGGGGGGGGGRPGGGG